MPRPVDKSNDPKTAFQIVGGEPHSWFMAARQLKKSADLIGNALKEVCSAYPDDRAPYEQLAVFKGYMLLAGLAMENLLKGILAGRDQKIVTPTALNKRFKTHRLCSLALQVLQDLTEHDQDLLKRLTDFVSWAGRYPIALREHENVHPAFVTTDPERIDRLFDRFATILQQENPASSVQYL